MNLIVATSPSASKDGQFLATDLNLIRASLLYADRVQLLSPSVIMVGGVAAMSASGPDGWLDALQQMDDETLAHFVSDREPKEFRELLDEYRQIVSLPREQRRKALGSHNRELQKIKNQFEQMVRATTGPLSPLQSMLDVAGVPELDAALESGLLSIEWDFMTPGAATDVQVAEYSEKLKDLLSEPDTHLLLDERMADMARSLIADGRVKPSGLTLSRAVRSRVGTDLVAHLPAFPTGKIATVLEARAELAEPLAVYRGGVTRLSQRVHSGAFEDTLGGEVTDLWRDEVVPAVDALRRDLSGTRLAKEAAVSLGTDVKSVIGGAGLFFGVQSFTTLHDFAAVGAAAAPVLGRAVATAYQDAAQRRHAAHRHDFFYLLELNDRL